MKCAVRCSVFLWLLLLLAWRGLAGNIVYSTSEGLWSSDGTSNPNSTMNIRPTVVGTFSALGFLPGYEMARLPDGRLVFGATGNTPGGSFINFVEGIQLWVTDGSAAGTVKIQSFLDIFNGQPNDTSRLKNFVTL